MEKRRKTKGERKNIKVGRERKRERKRKIKREKGERKIDGVSV